MSTLEITLCVAFGVIAAWHIILAAAFARILDQYQPLQRDQDDLPFASILLPLRGADPSLATGIRRLLDQDYPAYDIHIVIDGHHDPAWVLVEQILRESGTQRVHMGVVENRSTTCSPQCSALLQAVRNLDPRAEIVVVIDGDVLTHRSWLRELVSPLLDRHIGITHGNRWFIPSHDTWGSLVRALWNAGAVVPMHHFQIPWAGSMAIRKSVLISSGLLDAWPRTIVPDAPGKKLLSRMGLRIKFVPSLMMINRETCDLRFSHDFMKRQMLWTRLYHPHWCPVAIHATMMIVLLAAAAGLVVMSIAKGAHGNALRLATCLIVYVITMIMGYWLIDAAVRRVAGRRGEQLPHRAISHLARLCVAVPLTQLVHTSAVFLAAVQRQVTWRGISYHIHDAFNITVVADKPFSQPSGLSFPENSL